MTVGTKRSVVTVFAMFIFSVIILHYFTPNSGFYFPLASELLYSPPDFV